MKVCIRKEPVTTIYDESLGCDIIHESRKDRISLMVRIKGLGAKESRRFFRKLESAINAEMEQDYGRCRLSRGIACRQIEEREYEDMMEWQRDNFCFDEKDRTTVINRVREIAAMLQRELERGKSAWRTPLLVLSGR